MDRSIYVPIEKMSLKQYRQGLALGMWGGKEEKKYVEWTKNNPDNPYVDFKDEPTS